MVTLHLEFWNCGFRRRTVQLSEKFWKKDSTQYRRNTYAQVQTPRSSLPIRKTRVSVIVFL